MPVGITVVDAFGYVARVDGESMKPTLNPQPNDKEYIFLNKVSEFCAEKRATFESFSS